ncbi:MAG: hypothetical protein KY443_02090 [Actinobacteria bacterium]|nr:hypothetical protein [Actinomycetota bacterium]
MALASVLMMAAGLVAFRLQQDRTVTDDTRWMRTVSFGIAVAFVAGSVLCLVAVWLGRRSRALPPLVAGAVLLTLGVVVPTYFSAAYPLVLAIWGYAYLLRRDVRAAA